MLAGQPMITNLKLDKPLCIIDLETTGIDTQNDRIVEISILKLSPDLPSEHKTRRINPGVPIPPAASEVHKIYDHDVASCPRFEDYAQGILNFIGDSDLCGFNLIRFDLKILIHEFNRAGIAFSIDGRHLIDPCQIYHQREPRDLSAAMRYYCDQEHSAAHSAGSDVLATLAVLEGQLSKYVDLPRDVASLHEHFRDPRVVDLDGFFAFDDGGSIVFEKGKHRGRFLHIIAKSDRKYLEWMLTTDLMDDTKQVVRRTLGGPREVS